MVSTTTPIVRCDRCGRAEWPVTPAAASTSPPPAFVVRFDDVVIEWPDLCDGCRAAVKNALLRLAGRGTEVQPTRRRRDPESPASAADPAADPTMTPRADPFIDVFLRLREEGVELDLRERARELRLAGLDPSEAGWVLHHVFGLGMAEAVHIAQDAPTTRTAPP